MQQASFLNETIFYNKSFSDKLINYISALLPSLDALCHFSESEKGVYAVPYAELEHVH